MTTPTITNHGSGSTRLSAIRAAGALLAPVLVLPFGFTLTLVMTRGAAGGWVAWAVCVALVAAWLLRPRRSLVASGRRLRAGRVVLAATTAAVLASLCVPTVPVARRLPPDPSGQLGGRSATWTLPTGSQVAAYHYPAASAGRTTLLYLGGGPVRGVLPSEHRFLARLATLGYDVWTYDPAGSGRSGLLSDGDYTVERELHDLDAVIDRIGAGAIDVVGFSAGGSLLVRALADPPSAARIRRAVVAEPGPMDGPTAALAGATGRPNAGRLAVAPAGRRATVTPRYLAALGLEMSGWFPVDNAFVGQAELLDAFTNADLGANEASGFCAKDASRLPSAPNDGGSGFSFNPVASLRVQQSIRRSSGIAEALARSSTPAMVLLGECSSQVRAWQTAVIAADPAVDRVQYLTGVGHQLWNGLDNNDARAADVIDAYLAGRPAPLPNYPTPADLEDFLRRGE